MPPTNNNRIPTFEEARRLRSQGLTPQQIVQIYRPDAETPTQQPTQGTQQTTQNTPPPEDYGFFGNLGVGVAQGFGQVARNVGLLGRGIQRTIGSAVGLDENSPAYGGESRFDQGTQAYNRDSATLEPRGVSQNLGNLAGQIFPSTRAYLSLIHISEPTRPY